MLTHWTGHVVPGDPLLEGPSTAQLWLCSRSSSPIPHRSGINLSFGFWLSESSGGEVKGFGRKWEQWRIWTFRHGSLPGFSRNILVASSLASEGLGLAAPLVPLGYGQEMVVALRFWVPKLPILMLYSDIFQFILQALEVSDLPIRGTKLPFGTLEWKSNNSDRFGHFHHDS